MPNGTIRARLDFCVERPITLNAMENESIKKLKYLKTNRVPARKKTAAINIAFLWFCFCAINRLAAYPANEQTMIKHKNLTSE